MTIVSSVEIGVVSEALTFLLFSIVMRALMIHVLCYELSSRNNRFRTMWNSHQI